MLNVINMKMSMLMSGVDFTMILLIEVAYNILTL